MPASSVPLKRRTKRRGKKIRIHKELSPEFKSNINIGNIGKLLLYSRIVNTDVFSELRIYVLVFPSQKGQRETPLGFSLRFRHNPLPSRTEDIH